MAVVTAARSAARPGARGMTFSPVRALPTVRPARGEARPLVEEGGDDQQGERLPDVPHRLVPQRRAEAGGRVQHVAARGEQVEAAARGQFGHVGHQRGHPVEGEHGQQRGRRHHQREVDQPARGTTQCRHQRPRQSADSTHRAVAGRECPPGGTTIVSAQ
ncbi:hypothetical protein ACF060_06080 [Streptomyces werraensis]|uniref:hypothetical protein n=1 Tax=Streptomyces TaxID=1883 RepID=UPI001F5EA1CE